MPGRGDCARCLVGSTALAPPAAMRRPRHPFHPAAARAPLTCRLGWIAGPLLLAAFFVVSLWTSRLLASVYRVGDTEFARYHHAVLGILVSFNVHAGGG